MEFKIGDKVKCIKPWASVKKDKIYTFAGYYFDDYENEENKNYIKLKELLPDYPHSNFDVSRFIKHENIFIRALRKLGFKS